MATDKNWKTLQEEARDLQRQADALRNEEKRGVVKQIKEAIKAYEIEPGELYADLREGKPAKKATKAARKRDYTPRRIFTTAEKREYVRKAKEMMAAGDSLDTAAEKLGKLTPSALGRWIKGEGLGQLGQSGAKAKKKAAKKAPAAPAKAPAKKVA